MRGEEFAKDLGPLPPTKVHCTQLVEGAIRSALDPAAKTPVAVAAAAPVTATPVPVGNLNESFSAPRQGGVKVVFLDPKQSEKK